MTPVGGRGKRQIIDETNLLDAINGILKKYRVEGLLRVNYEKQIDEKIQYIGPGRGSSNRATKTVEKIRYQITSITRNEMEITSLIERFCWKAFATNAGKERLPLKDSVLCYRNEYRIERIFSRLKSRLNISPLFVKNENQTQGLTYLLTLGARVLTLIDFVLQRSLQKDKTSLDNLYPENPKKTTDKPTAERILKVFLGIYLIIIKNASGVEIMRWMTPLPTVQQEIIERLGLDINLYQKLGIQGFGI